MASASRRMSSRSSVTSPMMRMARPGPGKGCRQTMSSGRPSSSPTTRTSSLKSMRSGSTRSKSMSSGRPPTLWCDLILAAVAGARLDDVGVERALHQEVGLADLVRLLLEDADELLADDLALLLGVGDAGQLGQEALLGLHVHQRHVEVAAEGVLHLLALVLAHEAVVHEDAGELVADRLVGEQGRHGGIDAAGEAAHHRSLAHLGADALHGLLDDGHRRPGRARCRRSCRGSS